MKRFLISLSLLCLVGQATPLQAKEYVYDLYYRRNIALLDTNYRTNKRVMEELKDLIHNQKVDSIAVVSFASPDGIRNVELAAERSYQTESFILWLQSQVIPIKIGELSYTTSWKSLLPIVKTDANLPYRAELLQIISKNKNEQVVTTKLRQVGEGKLITYLDEFSLPHLRKSIITVYCPD
jgi:hypothetical protein